jgi:hypothetical protein
MHQSQIDLFDSVEGLSSRESGAYFSPDSVYRYALWRNWDWRGHGNCVMFVGLNPSTADELENDMTITKCIGFAKRWGFGGVYMLNLFAFVSTDPMKLWTASDPIGPGNDEALSYYRNCVGAVVVAWGSFFPPYRARLKWDQRIEQTLQAIGKPVECLGRTKDGNPRHPSRISYATERERFLNPRINWPAGVKP